MTYEDITTYLKKIHNSSKSDPSLHLYDTIIVKGKDVFCHSLVPVLTDDYDIARYDYVLPLKEPIDVDGIFFWDKCLYSANTYVVNSHGDKIVDKDDKCDRVLRIMRLFNNNEYVVLDDDRKYELCDGEVKIYHRKMTERDLTLYSVDRYKFREIVENGMLNNSRELRDLIVNTPQVKQIAHSYGSKKIINEFLDRGECINDDIANIRFLTLLLKNKITL